MEGSEKKEILIEERDGTGRITHRWLHNTELQEITQVRPSHQNTIPTLTTALTTSTTAGLANMRQILYDAFLPIGYPESVTPDYTGYQTFDSLQAFFSTITGLLANRAILQGLGVGDASSSATYALLLTILKDGISRVATIVFAYRFGLVIEPECKRYRYLADIFNDSAFFLDLFSPYFDPWTKVLALVLAEALRAMCGVAAGASKAALSKHFARRNNLSELNAKESSQETAVGLVGLLVGSIVVRYVESREAVFALMVTLVFVHLGMNYLGVRCVQLNVLNQQRATILFKHYLQTKRVLSPAQVAARESIVFWTPAVKDHRGEVITKIGFAKSYAHAMTADLKSARVRFVMPMYKEGHNQELTEKGGQKAHPGFILCLCERGDIATVRILLLGDRSPTEANDINTLMAWYYATMLAHDRNLGSKTGNKKLALGAISVDEIEMGESTDVLDFRVLEEAGWDVNAVNLDAFAPRISIGFEDKKEL
ncbi:vitamin B6 photo-protection and homoeostasis-domain-containing protein [Colletotrichum godetiae]|uniref:Vitamin B6 photo-protection and homoeostasis-domain-containing protein n=1 Tax=Colletotrichum godetiae TaxID=1209918 RepID=A0AAJ0ADF1_9PEZI|nr:vitamin B6 photo-protection and homoeostasis-domain-containing protein [Colletotrichum godetiae]KAK1671876.1 vitamin B6 photo-protection and homoeostasis-domain-containing protein [Colletotrichum godetiae]